jgi:hypothetical protein
MEKVNIIKNLIKSIDLSNINYRLIKQNSKYIYNLFTKIKSFWSDYKISPILHTPLTKSEYEQILKIISQSMFADNLKFSQILPTIKNFVKVSKNNVTFVYANLGNYSNDIEKINQLFSQSECLSNFTHSILPNNSHEILIIWIPIDSPRDFTFKEITKDNLKKSVDNFKAFTASGVTFNDNPRISIITRYEEISKLLIHELIHNLYLDGSNYHNHFTSIINTYKEIKNPISNKYPKETNYDYPFSIYESYTELLSSYLSMGFRNINETNKKKFIHRIKTEIIMELLYSFNTIGNLIKLNKLHYKNFIQSPKFQGDICFYEYYFIKAIAYNNFPFTLSVSKKDFDQTYKKIIGLDINDLLLKNICANTVHQTNFKYTFY